MRSSRLILGALFALVATLVVLALLRSDPAPAAVDAQPNGAETAQQVAPQAQSLEVPADLAASPRETARANVASSATATESTAADEDETPVAFLGTPSGAPSAIAPGLDAQFEARYAHWSRKQRQDAIAALTERRRVTRETIVDAEIRAREDAELSAEIDWLTKHQDP